MARKIIALTLCVMMLASIIVVPAFADEISYADYVPGEMPENMFRTNEEVLDESQENYSPYGFIGNVGTSFSNADPRVSRGSATNGVKITANGTPGEIMSGSAPAYYFTNGVYFGDKLIKGNNFVLENGTKSRSGDIAGNKNYVYSIQVKNLNADIVPNVHVLLYDLDAVGYSQYSKEYGAAGMAIEGTDWVDLKGTIKNADDSAKTHTANDVDRLSIGFPASTTYAGSSVEINCTDSGTGKHLPYFAEEAVYDITNTLTSSSDIVTTKNSAVFEAQIVNQIGLPGYLEQGEFIWKAMNTDRTEEISGITISADGATAEVTVDETVEFGSYDIVAYNSTYNMAKGYTITVDSPSDFMDYVPNPADKPVNLLISDTGLYASNTGFTSGDKVTRVANYNGYKWRQLTANGTPGEAMSGTATDWYRTNGFYFGSNLITSDGTTKGNLPDDTTLVFSMQVRNMEPKYTPYVTFMLYNFRASAQGRPEYVYPKEYGSAGMPLTSAEWTDFRGTLVNPADIENPASTGNTDISFGLGNLTPAGSKVDYNLVDTSEGMYRVYLGKEALYDITNELVEGSATLNFKSQGATFKAQLVNQVGLPGTLSQGTFTWKALDKDTRKTEIEGISIETSGDTATATVTVDDTVEAGEYVIVAVSDTEAMAKGYVITVEEPNYYEDYVKGSMPENMLREPSTVTSEGGFMGQIAQTVIVNPGDEAPVVSRGASKDGKVSITANGTEGEIMSGKKPPYYYTNGLYFGSNVIASNSDSGFAGDIADNKNYVYKIQVRNLNADITPNIHWLLYDLDGPSLNYSKEHGEAGIAVTSTDWMDFKGTITNPDRSTADTVNDVDRISIGFPRGTTYAGSSVEFNFTDESDGMYRAYFAEEAPYDITNALISGKAALKDGEKAEFKAEVLNQVGLAGNMEQNFTWRVMNKERTDDIDGFVISASGANAEVTVNGAEPGRYDVVACSTDYKMVKGFEITVTEDVPVPEVDEEITMIAVDETTDGLMLGGAKVEGSDRTSVTFAVVSYNGTVGIRDVAAASVDVTDGVATLKEPLTITAQAGDIIKVFAWDSKTLAPIAVADGVTNKYVK